MEKYLLGIDIGTSACKVAVFNKKGEVIGSGTGEYAVYYPKPGWAEQDPNEWWSAVSVTIKDILKETKIQAEEILGIGIDGQSWSAIPVDKKGVVLSNTPIWMDTRAESICERLNKKIGRDKIFKLSGNSLQPSYTTAKIIWYKENLPEIYKKIDKILQSNAFIAYKLTGKFSHDLSQGYGMHCFDMHTGTWDYNMCDELEIPRSFLSELVPSHQIIGKVTEDAAKVTGLAEGTPVVAGGLDAACGTLGAGVIHPGEAQEQGGQAGGMSICMDTYISDPRLILGYHVIPNMWLLQGGTTGGGGTMRWFENEFAAYERSLEKESGYSSLMQLNNMASKVNPGSDGLIFLPYMAGERSPIWDPKAKGIFYGLDFSKTKGHMVRAIMEGVAFALKHNLDVAESDGAIVDELMAVGGSANSQLWTQIKSDTVGKTIVVPFSDTATTLGAAMLAGVGIGLYKDFEEATKLCVRKTREHKPNMENFEILNKNYKKYIEIYEKLKDLMRD